MKVGKLVGKAVECQDCIETVLNIKSNNDTHASYLVSKHLGFDEVKWFVVHLIIWYEYHIIKLYCLFIIIYWTKMNFKHFNDNKIVVKIS